MKFQLLIDVEIVLISFQLLIDVEIVLISEKSGSKLQKKYRNFNDCWHFNIYKQDKF